MYGIVLILSLIVTGGVIAFIGDRLGTKIGKKRLSMFGLRPRHTSIIITVLTGSLITTLTFCVLAAASENVRVALFGMEELQREMSEKETALLNTTKLLGEQAEQLEISKTDIETLRKEQKELQAESDKLKDESEKLKIESDRLKEGNERLLALNDTLIAQNESIEKKNADLTAKNEALSLESEKLEKRAADLQTGLITMREGDIVIRANEVLASGVIRGGRTKAEVEADFAALANLASRNVSADVGANLSDTDIWIYPPEYEAAINEIVNSKTDSVVRILAAGNLLRGEAIRTSLEVYPNSIIYDKDEFIIARVYSVDDSRANMREEMLVDFLRQVNLAAGSRGILPDPIKGTVGVMDSEEFYAILNGLRPLHGNIILSAYAKERTDALGPLRLNVHWEKMNP